MGILCSSFAKRDQPQCTPHVADVEPRVADTEPTLDTCVSTLDTRISTLDVDIAQLKEDIAILWARMAGVKNEREVARESWRRLYANLAAYKLNPAYYDPRRYLV